MTHGIYNKREKKLECSVTMCFQVLCVIFNSTCTHKFTHMTHTHTAVVTKANQSKYVIDLVKIILFVVILYRFCIVRRN